VLFVSNKKYVKSMNCRSEVAKKFRFTTENFGSCVELPIRNRLLLPSGDCLGGWDGNHPQRHVCCGWDI
jgi:hypothetical protein